jgi:hypothetical protein
MTAITATGQRDTREYGFDAIPVLPYNLPVAANVNCRQGGIAVVPTTGSDAGYVKPGVTGLNLQAVGRFEESFNNTGGAVGGTSLDSIIGRAYVKVRSGAFWFANSASTDLIAQANVLGDCFIVDDATVALTNAGNTRSRAGKVLGVDTTLGVLVLMGSIFGPLAAQTNGIQVVTSQQLVAGTKTVGGVGGTFSLTATSVIIPVIRTIGAGAQGVHYDVPVVSRTVGAPGTAQFIVNAVSAAASSVLVNTDVNLLDFVIIG